MKIRIIALCFIFQKQHKLSFLGSEVYYFSLRANQHLFVPGPFEHTFILWGYQHTYHHIDSLHSLAICEFSSRKLGQCDKCGPKFTFLFLAKRRKKCFVSKQENLWVLFVGGKHGKGRSLGYTCKFIMTSTLAQMCVLCRCHTLCNITCSLSMCMSSAGLTT